MAALSPRRRLPIRSDCPCDGSQISGQFGVGGATPKPVPVVDAMDLQVRIEREYGWHVGTMDSVRGLEQPELRLQPPRLVGEECPSSTDAGSESGFDLGWVDAHRDHAGVRDLDLVLEIDQLSKGGLVLRAPEAAIKLKDGRVSTHQLGQPSAVAIVVR